MKWWQKILLKWATPTGLAATLIIAVLIAVASARPEPLTETELCTYYTVEQSGLQACWAAEVCFLSDEEFSELYVVRKKMIMHCARALTILMLAPIPEVEPEVEVEEPNNDLRAEIGGA